MKTSVIFLNLLVLCVDISHLKPLPERTPLELSHTDSNCGSTRIRRSIPEFDAVNPEYMAEEYLSGEGPAGFQKDISPFALGDHVSNFFKSNKPPPKIQNSPKSPVRQVPGERAMRVAEVEDGGMRTDEQEECYKQQNIEPPGTELENRAEMEQTQPKMLGAKYPMTHVAYGPRTAYINSEVLKKKEINHQPPEGDPMEIHSLYSEPEKQSKYQMKVKNYHKPKSSDAFDVHGRVYKPVEVQPKFPVYDEDIDFHPDPLQGILDDKYWLDPLEREAVIRKYIDLAANNMMSPDVKIVKRKAHEVNNLKRVNSKTDLKDADTRCPCNEVKQVVGCKECKGKGQRNITADDCGGVSYGRQLLWLAINEAEKPGESKVHTLEIIEGDKIDKDRDSVKETPSYLTRKVLSWEDGGVGEGEEEIGEDKGSWDYKQNVFHRRRILSYEENDESYDDDDGEQSDEYPNRSDPELNEQGIIYNIPKDKDQLRQVYLLPDEDDLKRSKEDYSVDIVYNEPRVDADLTKLKGNNRVLSQKINIVDTLDKPPAYFTPNKFANVLQKPLQKKPKGPKTSKEIDPNREFEVIRNETFLNATLELENVRPSDVAPASNGTANITNTGQARQSFRQRKDYKRFDNEGRHFTNVRDQADKYLHHQLVESDDYKDENTESAAPSVIEEPRVIPKDYTYLRKRSGEIKQRRQKGRQRNLKGQKNGPVNNTSYDCDGYSYKDGLNISKSDGYTQDIVEQSEAPPQENRTLRKRWDDRRMFAHKGRRSFTDLSSAKYSPVSLYQNPEDAVLPGSSGSNITSGGLNESKSNTTYSTKVDVNTTSTTNLTIVSLPGGIVNTTTLPPNNTSSLPATGKAKNKELEKEEDAVDTAIAKDIVETVISESQRNSVLGHHLGLCRRNESMGNANYGRVVPETEKVLKSVTDCIMSRLKSHLEKQSCVLLDIELLEFLKWMVLGGESYKDYLMVMRRYHDFLPKTTHKPSTCEVPTETVQTTCEVETLPPLLNGTI